MVCVVVRACVCVCAFVRDGDFSYIILKFDGVKIKKNVINEWPVNKVNKEVVKNRLFLVSTTACKRQPTNAVLSGV